MDTIHCVAGDSWNPYTESDDPKLVEHDDAYLIMLYPTEGKLWGIYKCPNCGIRYSHAEERLII